MSDWRIHHLARGSLTVLASMAQSSKPTFFLRILEVHRKVTIRIATMHSVQKLASSAGALSISPPIGGRGALLLAIIWTVQTASNSYRQGVTGKSSINKGTRYIIVTILLRFGNSEDIASKVFTRIHTARRELWNKAGSRALVSFGFPCDSDEIADWPGLSCS